ncbi:hypothetical protein [Mycobacterium avium]|uniref:hypothetical protein n=1 Tax=Mycobacterium avium TaxID=1764 RepID=UPI001EE73CD5|nr:hypothetical protein [Mycobacterium avium]
MTSPTAQPSSAVVSANQPYRRRPDAARAARAAQIAATARHTNMTRSSTGRVPYGPRHPRTDESSTSRAAVPYPPASTQPTRAGTPDRRHGFTAQRFIAAPAIP